MTAEASDSRRTQRAQRTQRSVALPGVTRRGRLRLRTLILIRWIAVMGQTTTILAVYLGFGFDLPLILCLGVIVTLALSNLYLSLRRASGSRLDDRAAALLLGFDVVQLAVLLYVTGGLQNPFAILIIAPVMVSATILSRAATIGLTLLALASISALAVLRTALPWSPGPLELPPVYVLGIWTALAVASVFISTYVWSVAEEARRMSDALTATHTLLARQQQLSALGGLAAAAAHELGSPLATIAVVAKELSREVPPGSPLAEDVELLLSQSARCRDILAGIAQTPENRAADPFDRLPISQLVEAAAEPHMGGPAEIDIIIEDDVAGTEPLLARSPEMLSGLGTLIQNAAQFAASCVMVTVRWDERHVVIGVQDDGPGFPPAVLAAIGEPFISTRAGDSEHMGLGIFIAQTLLARLGAELFFGNRAVGGAEVVIRWPRTILEREKSPKATKGEG
jgi:two-component system sensor histidine kinase RegB